MGQLEDLIPARPTAAHRAELDGREVDGWSLHVHGEGGRRRTVQVPTSAREAIVALHRLLPAPAPALVPALTVHRPARVADPLRAIASRTAQQLCHGRERLRQHRGPARLAHPHGFALRYLTPRRATLAWLQQLLGHEDIATTARYLAVVDEQRAPAPNDPWAR